MNVRIYRKLRKEHPELALPILDDLNSNFRSHVARMRPETLVRIRREYLLTKDSGPDAWSFKAIHRASFTSMLRNMKPIFDSRILKDVKPMDGWVKKV